jgi:hypothetical protein
MMQRWLTIPILAVLVVTACAYRPARFRDHVPITRVHDDAPIPLPNPERHIETVFLTETYLRRPVIAALDPRRFPKALDVNAMDEVPFSSWFWPIPLTTTQFFRAYNVDGPPQAPSTVSGNVLTDARGKKYRLSPDPADAPATSTAAAVIASRLLRASGYRTPEVWLANQGGKRMSATRWPVGIELGPTEMSSTRSDDPNDRVDHRDRRSLRAMVVFAAWLDIRSLARDRIVDAYIGTPPNGHVQHFIVGLGDALGAGSVGNPGPLYQPGGKVGGNGFKNLVTLGLSRPVPTRPTVKSLLVYSPEGAAEFSLSRPWEPVDRLLADDGYWAAKRILRIPQPIIREAIRLANLPEEGVASHIERVLEVRRQLLAKSWFARVTPCELVTLQGANLVLRDEAVAWDFERASESRYVVRFFDQNGEEVAEPRYRKGKGAELRLKIPAQALDHTYVVVSVKAVRNGIPAPRVCETHLVVKSRVPHVVGMRH